MAESTDFPIQRDNFQPEPAPDQGANDPGNYLSLGFQQATGALSPNNLSQFYRDQIAPTVDEGLGLVKRGVDAITPSEEGLQKFFRVLQAGGTQPGQIPVYMQEQKLQLEQQLRRDTLSQHLEAQQETKRQHNWQVTEKLIATGNVEALQEWGKQFPEAGMIARAVAKQDLAELPAYVDGGYIPKDFMQRLQKPKPGDAPVTAGEIRAHVDMAKIMYKDDAKEKAKQQHLQMALDTPEKERRPSQQMLVDEHQAVLDLKASQTEAHLAAAEKDRAFAKTGLPDHSEANRYHQSLFGVPFNQGTPETQQQALAVKSEAYQQGRLHVGMETPVGQSKSSQEWRHPISGQAAPSWATPKQLTNMGYVNIESTQVPTVTQLKNVDAAMKEILGAGSSFIRRSTGAGALTEIPLGMLQTPLVQLFKKYAGDPDAQVLQSALGRIAPAMAKLSGDTGNIALAEQQIYKDSVFSESDTLESFVAKIKSITDAQKRTRESMGFVSDEKSYMRRLIVQGKSDTEIKAIMDEQKRYQ